MIFEFLRAVKIVDHFSKAKRKTYEQEESNGSKNLIYDNQQNITYSTSHTISIDLDNIDNTDDKNINIFININ